MADLNSLKAYGFDFSGQGARRFKVGTPDTMARQLAADAAMITTANSAVPAELTAFIDPKVVEIMTAPRNARLLAAEVKKGDMTTAYAKWRVDEITGAVEPYGDFTKGVTADANSNWISREQYLFQVLINYGDLEVATSAVAKINLAAAKQRAAATTLDIAANKFALYGVANKQIYGLLNDPNLPAATTPASTGKNSSVKWKDKGTQQIFDDVRLLFNQLVTQSAGLITESDRLILALSPAASIHLGSATDFNVTVLDMLKKYFAALEIARLPELSSATAGETVLLLAPQVNGQDTCNIGFSIKAQAGRIVPDVSSFSQKWVSSTYGGIVYQPFAFASMLGV